MKIPKNKKMRFFLMSQGSFQPKIRFLGQKVCSVARLRTDGQKIYQCYIRKKSKNAYKKRKNENFEKQKNAFFSHVPRITQPKNQVPRPKSVPCSPRTDGQTHTKVTTDSTLSGFQEFFLQSIIKDRPNNILEYCYKGILLRMIDL